MKTIRHNRRGMTLAISLFFTVMVAVAGGALLSMSAITKLRIVERGEDIRLLIAAEAGIETMRGRFTLLAGVQDDWSALMPAPGWNNIGSELTINGIRVQVQARPTGSAATPHARVRGIAYGASMTRVVEYTVQAANFADYALYFGQNSTTGIGDNFKMVGNYYSRGDVDLLNGTGIEFFGTVDTAGRVRNYSNHAYNFKKGFTEYAPVITIPSSAWGMDPMRAAAQASGTLFYSNTLSIQLTGQTFIRTYQHRHTGSGSTYSASHYQTRTETLSIPDNSVIYIDSSKAPAGVDSYSSQTIRANQAQNSNLNLWGTLSSKRVTVACEHDIAVTNNISYQSLLSNPNLRRFSQKKGDAALAYREMLGVLSANDINFMTSSWSALPTAAEVTNIAGDTGHAGNQYTLDGVFMGVQKARRGVTVSGTNKELWVCGGIINGNYTTTELSSNFERRNYDTDYRLKQATPPYFLKAYGESANMIEGTWRTYEQ